MRFVKNFTLGISSSIEGTKFIFQKKLWWYFLFPVALMGLVYYFGVVMEDLLQDQESESNSSGTFLERFGNMMYYFLLFALEFMAFQFTKYIVLILISPVLSILSEKVEELVTGNRYPFNLIQLYKDIKRGAKIAIRNMMWEYSLTIVWLLVAYMFDIDSAVTWVVLFFVGAYFYGFSFIDYINERRRLDIPESVKFVRKHRGLAFSNGAIFSLFFIIPYGIGVIFAPIICIVGATLAMHQLVDLNKSQYAKKKKQPKIQTEE
jgi:CysZ protein